MSFHLEDNFLRTIIVGGDLILEYCDCVNGM